MACDVPAVQLRNVSVRAGGRDIVRGFSLVLPRGGRVVLVGPSGSGKTTVLRAVMGFARSVSGEVLIEGERLDAETVWRLRSLMAFVPQEPDLGRANVMDFLARPFEYRSNRSLRFDPAKASSTFAELALPERLLGEKVEKLSGGEKQRVALASALLLERRILVMDEATSALDAASRDAVIGCLSWRAELSVLAVSHDPAFLESGWPVIELTPLEEGASP